MKKIEITARRTGEKSYVEVPEGRVDHELNYYRTQVWWVAEARLA